MAEAPTSDATAAPMPPPVSAVSTPRERQWPALYTLITSWLLPATTARRTVAVPLYRAYGIHLLAGILTVLLVCFLSDIADDAGWGTGFGDLLEEFISDPDEAVLVTGFVILIIELGFLLLALAGLPWGASDEPLRTSFAHALRRTWLLTSHALPIVTLVGLLGVAVEKAENRQWDHAPVATTPRPVAPTPPSDPADQAAWDAYHQAYQKQQEDLAAWYAQEQEEFWQSRRERQPFLARHGEKFIGLACIGSGVWFLWALFRSTGTRREVPLIVRPPTCEFCGYNLQATPADSRCPECGEPVAHSLGPEVRTGTRWESSSRFGGLLAWGHCAFQAVFRPSSIGRVIRVSTAGHVHRRFILYPLPIAWLLSYLTIYITFVRGQGDDTFLEFYRIMMWFMAPMMAFLSTANAFLLAMIVAGLVGVVRSLLQKRNLLPAACQMACYLAGYLLLWCCFGAGLTILAGHMTERGLFEAGRLRWGIDAEMLTTFFWGCLQLLWLVVYILLLWRGITGAQYANR